MNDLPFIHLFKNNNKFYFYDVNKNRIVNVSKVTYENLASNNIYKSDEMSELFNEGLLSSKHINKIKHKETDYLSEYYKGSIDQMVLQVTQNCNFRCKYCVYSDKSTNRHHSNKTMTFETAKKALNFLLSHSYNTNEVHISFYGGEPLINFKLIKDCIAYANKIFVGKPVHYNLTSNASLLNCEIIDYFAENNVKLTISLDGPKQIHDKNRVFADSNKGSFDTVYKNIELIKKTQPKYFKENVMFNMVIDPQNDYCVIDKFLTQDKLIKDIPINAGIENTNDFVDKQQKISDNFIEEYRYEIFLCFLSVIGIVKQKHLSKLTLRQFNRLIFENNGFNCSDLPDEFEHAGPCIPGISKTFVNTEGNLYPCESVNENSDECCFGNIYDGVNLEKANALLNIGIATEEQCKSCWAIRNCKVCIGLIDSSKPLTKKNINPYCVDIRKNLEEKMKNYCLLDDLKETIIL